MGRRVTVVGLLLIFLGVVGFAGKVPSLEAHDPIIIIGDEGFTAENGVRRGSGTEEDPYILEGWEIDGQGRSGIYIERTTAHFIIRDCRVYGAGSRSYGYAGIRLLIVKNGTIESCEISSNKGDGIWLGASSNIEVRGNWIRKNADYGIILDASTEVLIEGNTISENASGIWLGIYAASNANKIQFNDIASNRIFGLALDKSSSANTVCDNWIESSMIGISGSMISTNEITTNLLKGNTAYGIGLSSSWDNRIYLNNFIGNEYNAFDKGRNYWDDGAHGNYWDDYRGKYPDAAGMNDTWNIPYKVSGGENVDRYPLVRPMVCLKRTWGKPGVKLCSP